MFLIDKPYVSDFLKETLKKYQIPVIKTKTAKELLPERGYSFISEEEAILLLKENPRPMLHTNSENALDWIEKKLPESDLARNNKIFKNKNTFRQILKPLYPNYYFKKIKLIDIEKLNEEKLPYPIILKPAVGFISLGVHHINNSNEWKQAVSTFKEDVIRFKEIYPESVLNLNELIIEEYIEGDEFAVDCYYDGEGLPTILNIMKHQFHSEKDVSDRVYHLSKEIIEKYMDLMESFLEKMGKMLEIKNYSLHIELRINEKGDINPIEVNPLRFGGWCTSADMSRFAYNINTYEYCINQKKPDWNLVLQGKDDLVYGLIVLNNSTGVKAKEIDFFDYEKLLSKFNKPLELRRVNYKEFEVFGFLFVETYKNHLGELEYILASDLCEFIYSS